MGAEGTLTTIIAREHPRNYPEKRETCLAPGFGQILFHRKCTIRLILDNHSAHISKETQAYLETRPNRFRYVLTPTHGSWLNIVETLFRTFLKNIRVKSWEELRDRILRGVAEGQRRTGVHRWRKFDALDEVIF
jgi:hypothetical protein